MNQALTDEKQRLLTAIDAVLQTAGPRQLRAVAYLRVSTEEQLKGYGIAYTGKRVVKHIAKKEWALVDVFADEGYSGSLDHTQRPDLGQLMKLARQTPRPFDLVTVYEERAIGRADRAFWPWVWELQDLGVFVAVTKGDYDNTSDEGRSRMRKAADRAEDERITIRDRTQGGIQEKAEDGGHFGGRPPFGWRIVNKGVKGESHLTLDTDGDVDSEKLSHAALRMGWQFIVKEHNSRNNAARRLDALGYDSPTGEGWCGETLYRILTSPPVQKGVRIFRNPATAGRERGTKLDADGNPLYGSTIEVKIPRAFTEDEVRLLNAALKRQARGHRADDATHPLSTRLFGQCTAHFTGNTRDSGTDRVYRCSGKHEPKAKVRKSDCSQIDAGAIEKRIWTEVCALLSSPERLATMADDWASMAAASGTNHADRIAELEDQLAGQDAAIQATVLAAAHKSGGVAKAISQAIEQLEKEREHTEQLLTDVKAWQQESEASAQRARDLQTLAEIAQERLRDMTAAEQAEVLDLLDIRVTLLGNVPSRKSKDDQVAQWFRANGGIVPTLTDETWAKAEPVFTGPSAGRPTRPPRLMLEALLHKAVSRCSWREIGEQYGPWPTVASTWRRWSERGVWAEGMELLAGTPGTPGTPIPPEEIALPPIRVEGRLDPRLLVSTQEPSAEGLPLGSPIRGLFRVLWVTSDPQCERTWEKRSPEEVRIV